MGEGEGDISVDTFGYHESHQHRGEGSETRSRSCRRLDLVDVGALTDDGLFEFSSTIEIKEFPGPKGKDHTLVVLLKMIVDPRHDQGGQLSLREGIILV